MSANRRLFVCTICLIENQDSQHVLTCTYHNIADEINISIIMTLTLFIFFLINKYKKTGIKSVE
jgi:hypothetical protein